jgi:hypothetical protein
MLDFFTDLTPKAKKEHKCEMCRGVILPGEKYHRQSGKYDGEFFDRKLHNSCNNIITTYCSENGESEFEYDGIDDWLRDVYCYDCTEKEDCEASTFECEKILKNFKENEEWQSKKQMK